MALCSGSGKVDREFSNHLYFRHYLTGTFGTWACSESGGRASGSTSVRAPSRSCNLTARDETSNSGREIIVKKVQLPRATPREIADAIQLEAEHHIPFAIDEVFLDYQVVGE